MINCWDDKAFWSFWRPITAIREGDADGNDKTAGDPAWTSLVASPPYPDHPSGYNCGTSAFMHAAEAFFGKGKRSFAVTAPELETAARQPRACMPPQGKPESVVCTASLIHRVQPAPPGLLM